MNLRKDEKWYFEIRFVQSVEKRIYLFARNFLTYFWKRKRKENFFFLLNIAGSVPGGIVSTPEGVSKTVKKNTSKSDHLRKLAMEWYLLTRSNSQDSDCYTLEKETNCFQKIDEWWSWIISSIFFLFSDKNLFYFSFCIYVRHSCCI